MKDKIFSMPKIELHDHLDGSLRPLTLIELLKKENKYSKIRTLDSLQEFIRNNINQKSLPAYLETFKLTNAVMQSTENLERIAYETAEDFAAENIIYAETRFAPELHTLNGLTMEQAIEAVASGFNRGKKEFNIYGGIILCAMRHNTPENADQVAQLALKYKHLGICGFDIAGAEEGNPPEKFLKTFRFLKSSGFPVTIHAGEAAGYEYINTAIMDCKASRIGHGIKSIKAPDKLCTNILKEKNIHLEVCISSNIQTGAAESIENHPAIELRKRKVSFSFCSDNRLVSNTNLTKELNLAMEKLGFKLKHLIEMQKNSAKYVFAEETVKNKLLEKIINFENSL